MEHSILKVNITSGFEKSFRKLPSHIQRLAEKKDKWFRQNAFSRHLHAHKLKGELLGYWAYHVNYQYRILFRFLSDNEVIYYDIGTHDIYK